MPESQVPANQLRLSRFRDPCMSGLVSRQERQIVQPQLNLRDLLPGFRLQVLCRAGRTGREGGSSAIRPGSVSREVSMVTSLDSGYLVEWLPLTGKVN